ncbi:uncharacterized protein LOC105248406 [Camponotus floridanus]|uniref:uncharacterized protein LOC105248406 n=1 Tax=Camponotus floridanus TaxID=104421 RepID=UPI000DC69F57|nr:uncharacterized protein LOC105248406 [Camponotus floridanus]
MSSELEAATELNSTFPDGTGAVVVRAEEALIVILVLVLWVAAIALFFNRWGKIRMLEPYQPKFQQQHRQSCSIVDPTPIQHRSYSKFNIHCLEHPISYVSADGPVARLRQNSVFVGSSASLLLSSQETPRRAKSAFDLQSLVHAEVADEEERDGDTLRTLRSIGETSRLLQRDRRPSVYQFDRMDVLARPTVQRERGMSICQFDRTDVLARPLQRDRGNSICHFDRTDVLARPTFPSGKSLLRERRVSVCNFLERYEDPSSNRNLQRDRRLSVSNVDKIETLGRSLSPRDFRSSVNNAFDNNRQDSLARCSAIIERNSSVHHFDRPSCSKTPDVVLGYKATCV